MNVEEFESIKDFQRAFLILADECAKKFRGEISEVHIYPKDYIAKILFK